MADGVDLSRKFVSESELEERRKKRQEEWEKVRKPEDPEEVPEEEYDPRSLFERLQEQKDKKQEEFEEQFKFKNMVRGLDEDETSFLDEVSRQQSLVEKQRRDEELQEIQEYRSALKKLAAGESQKKEPEKRAGTKPPELKTSHLSQAHLLAGAVKRRSRHPEWLPAGQAAGELRGGAGRSVHSHSAFPTSHSSSQSSESSKKLKGEEPAAATNAAGNGSQTEQEAGELEEASAAGVTRAGMTRAGVLHLPSAAVCVGILPGLGAYSGSSDSESSSDSEV